MIGHYNRHVADVREYFQQRPCDLLEVNLTAEPTSSWAAINEFLGSSILSRPPKSVHVNKLLTSSVIALATRPGSARRSVEQMQVQDYPGLTEVIVVDDSLPEHRLALADIAQLKEMLTPVGLRYIALEGHHPGHALNTAINAATGEVIVLLQEAVKAGSRLVSTLMSPLIRQPLTDLSLFRNPLLFNTSGSRLFTAKGAVLSSVMAFRPKLWASKAGNSLFGNHSMTEYTWLSQWLQQGVEHVETIAAIEAGGGPDCVHVLSADGTVDWTAVAQAITSIDVDAVETDALGLSSGMQTPAHKLFQDGVCFLL
jgi:hypothetical protein